MNKSERETENITQKLLSKVGIFDNENYLVELQKSLNPTIQRLLKNSSKSGDGLGKPEFIITSKIGDKDFLIVIECKNNKKFHISENKNEYKDYAVDGVLLYSSNLSKEFNVISVGISGDNIKDLKISTYFQPKNASNATVLIDENNKPVENILEWDRYIKLAKFDPASCKNETQRSHEIFKRTS